MLFNTNAMQRSSGSFIAFLAPLCFSVNTVVSLTIIERPTESEKVRFDDYHLYRICPSTLAQHRALMNIGTSEGYSFWRLPKAVDDCADLMVSPENLGPFQSLANDRMIKVEDLMDDVQRYIDVENSLPKANDAFGWSSYYDLESIYRWMDGLARDYPNLITPLVGGETYEGRNISGVKLSYHEGNPGVFIEGGIHAREWISPATVTYMLNQLLTSSDPKVRGTAESYDWYFFPVFNPDGYVYTHTTNRLWRKTRKPYASSFCYGADPNRNWGFHWNDGGSSSNPCSETFAGSSAFSEPETKTMSKFVASIKDKLFAYISYHSYSQLILLPYGYTDVPVYNYNDLMQIGNASAIALAKRYGTSYKVGNIVDVLYVASGGSTDWSRGTTDIPVTFTYELRDQGRYGFLLPDNQIIPTGEETLDSLVALLQESEKLGYGVRRT